MYTIHNTVHCTLLLLRRKLLYVHSPQSTGKCGKFLNLAQFLTSNMMWKGNCKKHVLCVATVPQTAKLYCSFTLLKNAGLDKQQCTWTRGHYDKMKSRNLWKIIFLQIKIIRDFYFYKFRLISLHGKMQGVAITRDASAPSFTMVRTHRCAQFASIAQ
jgi:hypothetical protein